MRRWSDSRLEMKREVERRASTVAFDMIFIAVRTYMGSLCVGLSCGRALLHRR